MVDGLPKPIHTIRGALLSSPSLHRVVTAFGAAAAIPVALLAAAPGWVPIGPPGNVDVRAIAMDKNRVLYAAVDGAGVLKTSNGGANWTAIDAGLTSLAVRALVVSPSVPATLFVGTAGAGVFRSDGESWTAANNGLTDLSVTSLAQDAFGLALYAGTKSSGAFKSDDGGATWKPVNNGLNDVRVLALAVDPSSSADVFATTATDLYRSTDGGAHWLPTRPVVNSITYILGEVGLGSSPPAVYTEMTACGPLPCIPGQPIPPFPSLPPATGLKSVDGGTTWSVYPGRDSVHFAVDPFPPFGVYGAGGSVNQSLDGGATWTRLDSLPIGTGTTRTVTVLGGPPSTLLVGTERGGILMYGSCLPSPEALCLTGPRFQATVSWRDSAGQLQAGHASPVVPNSGAFWFFDPSNLELVVKVLDGRSVNGKFWVFYGSMTNVEFTLTITDTQTGAVKTYVNPQGQLASVADTSAF